MKVDQLPLVLLAATTLTLSLSIRSLESNNENSISLRDAEADPNVLNGDHTAGFKSEIAGYLEKRRGGGGSGGGGGRSGGSSGGSSGSSGGSSGGSGGGSSGGSSGGTGGSGGSSGGGSRNTGSASSSSSISPSYGGGKYYGGGAASPYRAGGRSPAAGIVPFALVGGIAGAALIFPGVWAYGAYNYPYTHQYSFHNRTNTSEPANQNETLPVTCLCQMYSACGCDDNGNSTYLDQVIGSGSPSQENSSLVHVGPVNGTKTVVLNGTLPNGTDTSAAAATTSSSSSASAAGMVPMRNLAEGGGLWVLGGVVGAAVWML